MPEVPDGRARGMQFCSTSSTKLSARRLAVHRLIVDTPTDATVHLPNPKGREASLLTTLEICQHADGHDGIPDGAGVEGQRHR